jgi:hypothetical protein
MRNFGQMLLDALGNAIPALGLDTALTTGSQTLDGSAASASSTVFDSKHHRVIRVACVDDTWLKVGTAPTAVLEEGAFFPGGSVEYVNVHKNEKIAVIGGIVSVTKTK